MKAIVAKKGGRVIAIAVANPEVPGPKARHPKLDPSLTIVAAKGVQINEVEMPDADFQDTERLSRRLEKLGAKFTSRSPAKRVPKDKASRK